MTDRKRMTKGFQRKLCFALRDFYEATLPPSPCFCICGDHTLEHKNEEETFYDVCKGLNCIERVIVDLTTENNHLTESNSGLFSDVGNLQEALFNKDKKLQLVGELLKDPTEIRIQLAKMTTQEKSLEDFADSFTKSEEKSIYLTDPGENSFLASIKMIRTIYKLGLKEAKAIADAARDRQDTVLEKNVTELRFNEVRKRFEDIGATVKYY